MVPHFRSHLRKIRAGQYDLQRQLGDMCDFAIDNGRNSVLHFKFDSSNFLERIIYYNDGDGFQNLNKKGLENPLNFGYENSDVHCNDEYESTFGGGTKDAWISCANMIQLITKVNPQSFSPSYKEAQFDINEMRHNLDTIESYMPDIKQVTKYYFENKARKHNVELEGTLVILSQLEEQYKRHIPEGNREQFCNEIAELINTLYWKKMTQTSITVEIRVDGCLSKVVNGTPFYNLESFVSYADITTIMTIIFIDNVEKEVLYETQYYKTPEDGRDEVLTHRYAYKYDNTNAYEKLGDGNRGRDRYQTRINTYKRDNPTNYKEMKAVMVSRVLKSSTQNEKAHNIVNIYRNGRFYGNKQFSKRTLNEAPSSNIYNEFVYTSKVMNALLGVKSSKSIDTSIETRSILWSVLKKTTTTYKGKKWLGNIANGRISEFIHYVNTINLPETTPHQTITQQRDAKRDFIEELKLKYDEIFEDENYRDYTRMSQFENLNQKIIDLYNDIDEERKINRS